MPTKRHNAPETFRTKKEADAWLAAQQTAIQTGNWIDPAGGKVTLRAYSRRWLADRPGLRPRTVQLYDGLLRLHILPKLGEIALVDLQPTTIRSWHADMLGARKVGASTTAKAYRHLRAILTTAADDRLIPWNPCKIRGAGEEHPIERTPRDVAQVWSLADAIEDRFRAPLLVAAFMGLRLGELRALRRRNIDLLRQTLNVVEQVQDLKGGPTFSEPKTAKGVRTLPIPKVIVADIEAHLTTFAQPGADGLIFATKGGEPMRRASWYRAWERAKAEVGVADDVNPHDLRHTMGTLAAQHGASEADIQALLGHATGAATRVYTHATAARVAVVVAAISEAAEAKRPSRGATGAPVVNVA